MHELAKKTDSIDIIKLLKPFVKEETLKVIDKNGKKAYEYASNQAILILIKPKDEQSE
jgi:hypothetical protein